ncbi:hypothetical protein JCM8547_003779 [Rhodosporidiobolus lusitaniae]
MPNASGFTFDPAHADLMRTDLEWRVVFARDFLGFTDEDGATLNSVKSIVAPLVEPIVDSVYVHLFQFDYTKASFLKRNAGFKGEHATSLDKLNLDDPQIAFRKTFLKTYVTKLFSSDYTSFTTFQYLHKVAIMHTGAPGFKHRENKDPLVVQLQPMALLLGWVSNIVIQAVVGLPEDVEDAERKSKILTAFNKIIWIQNDLFNMEYARTPEQLAAATKAKQEEQ